LIEGPSYTITRVLGKDFACHARFPLGLPLRDHPRFQALLEEYRDDVEH
jgi:hypothetical protein